uniref:Uncharacterized protein n=1 Tax=Tetranychus urticae TaxID=32264 RepID=T1JSL8_TETUR
MITGGREKAVKSDKHCRSLVRVGSSINHAVERD